MIFSQRLSLSSLIGLCRVLRHNLGAGLTLRAVFRQQAERGTRAVRPLAQRIRAALDRGQDLTEALKKEEAVFPPLFLAMASVGEETGHLPEVFGELENYFTLQEKLRRQFRAQTFLPIVQLIFAVLILALLIFILSLIPGRQGESGPGILGFRGASGALAFLAVSFGTLALIYVGLRLLPGLIRGQAAVDGLLLRLPALGPCVEAAALGRFALALQLTLESNLSIQQALRLSLQATGNAAYQSRTEAIVKALQDGKDLTTALTQTRLFPEVFLNLVSTAEEGGRLPEMMRHQAAYYHEEAERRLTTLTRLLSLGVWFVYAAFMVAAIFHLFKRYLGAQGG